MKRQIIITLILLIAAVLVTIVYFKNLNPPGLRTSQVMRTIPNNATLIFEFNNDGGFYDIFNGGILLTAVLGKENLAEFDTLRKQLLENKLLEKFFTRQNIFISLHPSNNNEINFLLTIAAINGFKPGIFEQLIKKPGSGLLITSLAIDGKMGYTIYLKGLKKRFFLINKGDNILTGSFSDELVKQSAKYKSETQKQAFVLMTEQQNSNSLANLYVNYTQLSPLFENLFKNTNTDIFKSFRLLPALAALSLNYKSDALMFNGFTRIQNNQSITYLNLFAYQQPVINHLKDIFPSTTAYSTNFAVSDPEKFESDLAQWHVKAGLKNEKDLLLNKIKAETGINLKVEFDHLLNNEFAVITTRYQEKFALIAVKNGSKLKPFMMNISNMVNDNTGQFKYDKLPYFLLGDAFNVFRKPYFMIIDNYLILANNTRELESYYNTYIDRKFLNKNSQYNQFDDLLAERSNVSFFINIKNSQQILKRDLKPEFYAALQNNEPGWKSFYAGSYQLTASDKNFYTNFCMRLNSIDTTIVK